MFYGVGELVAAGYALDDDVFVFDTGGCEGFLCAGEEGVDDGGVPAGVDDADAEAGAWVGWGVSFALREMCWNGRADGIVDEIDLGLGLD